MRQVFKYLGAFVAVVAVSMTAMFTLAVNEGTDRTRKIASLSKTEKSILTYTSLLEYKLLHDKRSFYSYDRIVDSATFTALKEEVYIRLR